jgi:hypothetical protein
VISIFAVNLFVIGLAVIIHYEFLYRITLLMPMMKIKYKKYKWGIGKKSTRATQSHPDL